MPVSGLNKVMAKSVDAGFRFIGAGAKGRQNRLIIEVDGVLRDNFMEKLTRAAEGVDKNLKNKHVTLLRELGRRAKDNLYKDIKRPNESGRRGEIRQTKNFTFGTRATNASGGRVSGGGAFVGVLIDNKNESGFGYPDIAQADRKTKRVWRTLEFGIGPRGMDHPEGPVGKPKMPQRFGFTGPNPKSARLMVLQGPAVENPVYVQMFKTGQRRKNVRKKSRVVLQGQAPKLFITRAIDEMVGKVGKEYTRAAAESYKSL